MKVGVSVECFIPAREGLFPSPALPIRRGVAMDREMECEYCGNQEHSILLSAPNLFGKEIYLCRKCTLFHRIMEPYGNGKGFTGSVSSAPRRFYTT